LKEKNTGVKGKLPERRNDFPGFEKLNGILPDFMGS
jgi:hypothetical protein